MLEEELGEDEKKFVVFRLGDSGFAVDASCVVEMLQLTNITPLPFGEAWSRGVINLRGRVLPVVDLRIRLGLKSLEEENTDFQLRLERAEKYVRTWIDALTECAANGNCFDLPADPRESEFGQWYTNYKATNLIMETQVAKFAAPCEEMSRIAKEVIRFAQQGHCDDAVPLVEKLRNGSVAQFVDLCASTRSLVVDSCRELAVVVEVKGLPRPVALSVDQVEAVDTLKVPEGQAELGGVDFVKLSNPLIAEMALFRGDDLVGVLDFSDAQNLAA